MAALHRSPLAPTGCSHAISVRLCTEHDASSGSSSRGTVISHLVTARDSLLQVWEVREYGEAGATTAKLQHLLTRRLHGTITSLARVRTLASKLDGADRILVSFLDAKMSLIEWTPAAHELLPVSLHTFEKLPQVTEGLARSATDPGSRLSVMLLPSNTGGDAILAILPFFQEDLDLESMGVDSSAFEMAALPYAPSHLLPLASLTSSHSSFPAASRSTTLSNAPTSGPPVVRNVIDLVFLPGFNEPTLALLYAPEQAWSGRVDGSANNCLVSLVTLAASATPGTESGETSAILIATSPPLPYSSLAIHPCPPDLGGLLIVTANGILHLEQGGKVIGTPANGWFAKEWTATGGGARGVEVETVKEGLEGSKVVFVANNRAIIYCRTGTILELTLQTSGRSVSSMKLQRVGTGVAGSCVERIRGSAGRFGEDGYVFVGSEVGESVLMRWELSGARASGLHSAAAKAEEDMDYDDEDGIYGPATGVKAETTIYDLATSNVRPAGDGALLLSLSDVVSAYGGIRSMTVGLIGDNAPAELVACTGGGVTAGLTIFLRSISPRKRRKLDLNSVATRGIWSLALPGGPADHLLVTSDHASSKMVCRIAGVSGLDVETQDATVTVATILAGAGVVRVTPTSIILSDRNLTVHQTIALQGPAVVRACVSDPHVLVTRADRTASLFVAHAKSGSLVEMPIPPHLLTSLAGACLFTDHSGVVPFVRPKPVTSASAAAATKEAQLVDDEDDDLYATAPKRKLVAQANVQGSLVIPPPPSIGAGPAGAWAWIPLVDASGNLEILSLPSLETIFTSSAICLFPDVIEDGEDGGIPDGLDADDIEIDQILCISVGQSRPRPHLLILLTNGSLAVYEAIPSISAAVASTRPQTLGVRFVKTVTRRLPVRMRARAKPGAEPELPPPPREFVPFESVAGYTGAFLTGDDPLWLLAADHGPARLYDHSEKSIYGFSKVAFDGRADQYLTQSRTEVTVASLPEDMCIDREMPYTKIARDRRYGSFTYDMDSGLYVAGGLFDTVFMNFDDEGVPVYVNDSTELLEPRNMRSALELIVPGTWEAVHGYEFRPNEFISTVKTVSLASSSTGRGRKEFIAVGTTVYRGEDLAARGGIYIFEVVRIVPDPSRPLHDHQLKLLFFEDTKSVVGNVTDIDGYLVMSMGQKLYVRAFEQDEVLLAVGFLDVGVHVTSLESMKNFLLIGDALKSVTLVAFQSNPYKLVILGRDYRPNLTTSANFLVNDGRLAFIMNDPKGVLRLFEYDPTNIASFAGQKLMCRTEYHAGAEAVATLLYAKRSRNEKDELKQNGILYGCVDGSLGTLVPVRDVVFKRLQLLQVQIARHVQHFGGLNPRGYRIVKNDSVSRAITKGILDGELLAEFERLPHDQQVALTTSIGTDPDTVLLNLRDLAAW